MPYYARKQQLNSSLVYHAFNRSNARASIFNTKDYSCFIELVKDYINRFNINIYHWVIMSNHYHLLFEIAKPENISKFMAGFNRSYTHYYHKTYCTSGFLWQGRFKLQPVQKGIYLVACGRYIERNPVRAGIVQEAQDYSYSSARFYCFGESDLITTEDPLFIQFGLEASKRQLAYKEFLRNFNQEEERRFENLKTPQGNKEFLRRLTKEHGRYITRRRGRPERFFP